MFQDAQNILDRIAAEKRVEEWLRTSTTTTTTSAPPLVFEDEADLSVSNEIHQEFHDVSLDQSNHGFSFVNTHWASFSTDLSSVLAVLVALAMVAGCCYFRGRRQRQSCDHHAELLKSIVSGSRKAVSTPHRTQFRAYPGTSGSSQVLSDTHSYPVVSYTPPASSASGGLPGCSTSYSARPALSAPVSSGCALPVTYNAAKAIAFIDHRQSAKSVQKIEISIFAGCWPTARFG